MNLLYSDVEEQLRASVRALLADRAPWTSVLARAETAEPYDPALWQALGAELGATGLAVPGSGASWREVAVVAEELGRSVAGTPFLGSAVLATATALHAGADDLLAGLAAGTATAALAIGFATVPGAAFPDTVRADGRGAEAVVLSGTVTGVADTHLTGHLLVPAVTDDGPVLAQVDASAARIEPVVSLDLTRPLADVHLDGAAATVLAGGDGAGAALQAALTAGAVALASEQVGLAQRCLELTVDYLKVRHQFGHPIGQFQALKHRCSDLWAAIAQARAVARYAADRLAADSADGNSADGNSDTAVAASLAQAYCAPVAVQAAEECVQLHGGIGFTWEHPAHLYLKRAKADALALGTASRHRARLAELVNLPAA